MKNTIQNTEDISLKIHRSYRVVVAVCDLELINKKFEEGKLQIHLKENFYKDKITNVEEAIRIIKQQMLNDATFNIVGKNSISAAISAGLIEPSGIGSIRGIPFALTLS